MKKGFTLIEMMIVLVIIGVLMAATMRFGSNRITDLKAQSLKEQFVGYYNEIYGQNMTSSFRDGKKYQTLVVSFESGMWYKIDQGPFVVEPKLSALTFHELLLDDQTTDHINLTFVPYRLGCFITSSQGTTGDLFSFQVYMPENGKQYCFEIKSETCKLIEQRCK
ncbi:MAG: type II secretion system protein [candidate division SR1 bacterium]|nr:type II secretion system protein [candidate division SR1 bacterium]